MAGKFYLGFMSTEIPFNPQLIDGLNYTLWRYQAFIPHVKNQTITLGEGLTPLCKIDFNGKQIYVKQEQLFPTGSYKDRGATVLMSHVHAHGIKHVVQDSSGNAGCAIAAYAAAAKITCDIYVPASTSEAKLAQIKHYGANLIKIEGTREDTAAAALEAAKTTYYASHVYNDLFLEGTKTFAYEIAEQLNWKVPDVVVLPAGNGTLLLGAYKGFKHLLESGVISKMPRLVAIQAQNCAPLVNFEKNITTDFKSTPTVAEGIAIAKPYRANEMLQAIHKTNGLLLTVTEHEIIDALKWCIQQGFYIEPTSAATIAGTKKALTYLEEENWVTLFSGHGLKTTETINKLMNR